jgi:hypothetical protein
MKYIDILRSVDAVGGYMTDPIGKCLRTTCGKKKTRIDKLYADSATYRAFLSRDDLQGRFDPARAEKAVLCWIEVPSTGAFFPDFPVSVDRASGIIEEQRPDGSKCYGILSDVQGCVVFS